MFLQRGYQGAPRPHPHLAFDVEAADLDRFRARLDEAGVPYDGPRRMGPPGHASIYFSDPAGNLLELSTMGYRGDVVTGTPDLGALLPHRPRPAPVIG